MNMLHTLPSSLLRLACAVYRVHNSGAEERRHRHQHWHRRLRDPTRNGCGAPQARRWIQNGMAAACRLRGTLYLLAARASAQEYAKRAPPWPGAASGPRAGHGRTIGSATEGAAQSLEALPLCVSRRGRAGRPHRYGLPGDTDLVNGCADDERGDDIHGELRAPSICLYQEGRPGETLLGSPIALERYGAESQHAKVAETAVEYF